MNRQVAILALVITGCAVPIETQEEPWAPNTGQEEPGQVNPAPRPPEPDLCGPAGFKGGVEIPVECYDGPPRFDDVEEIINPWQQQLAPEEQQTQQQPQQ